jgi:hypothetical protein
VYPAFSSSNSALLEPDVRRHPLGRVAAGQLEHPRVQGVEPGERDELEPVAHCREARLELGDRVVVQVALPVEGRRAVVGEQLARERVVDRGGDRGEPSSAVAAFLATASAFKG